MDKTLIKPIIEAALLASSQPLSMPQLEQLFQLENEPAVSHEELATALESLREDQQGRGIELVEVASGFRFQVRQDIHPWVSRLWTERPSRYSRALLETLALIAYRQPITRGEIEQVRGVTVSSNIVKTLEEREWVRVVGHRDAPGRPALLGTTRAFLDYFNLKSLDELPPLADILNLEDPQLAFATGEAIPAQVDGPTTADTSASPDDGTGGVEASVPAADSTDETPSAADETTPDADATAPDTAPTEPGSDSEEIRA